MTVKSERYGELDLAFTYTFDLRWNDQDSGGTYAGAFWHPIPPAGDFYPLGGVGVNGYEDINGKRAALCVRAAQPPGDTLPPTAFPKDYEKIWDDEDSGAKRDGSCWRPIPPSDDYVAMGDVFVKGHGTKPAFNDVVCVRRDLTHLAIANEFIWNDRHAGSRRDFGAWRIAPPPDYADPELGLFAAETFIGVASHTKPEFDPVLNVLMLRPTSSSTNEPPPPVLTSRAKPPLRTVDVVDHTVTVPFTAIRDDAFDVKWKVDNSPFYEIERHVAYSLILFEDNQTSVEQHKVDSLTVGVEKSESETFSRTTGIEVSVESGISFIEEAKVSATVSVQLGYEHSTGVTNFQSKTVERSLSIPPNTSAALWVASYGFEAVRSDGSRVSVPLNYDSESFASSQFPPVVGEAG